MLNRRATAKALLERWATKRSKEVQLKEARNLAAAPKASGVVQSDRPTAEVQECWKLFVGKASERAQQKLTAPGIKALGVLNAAVRSLDAEMLHVAIQQAAKAGVPTIHHRVALAQDLHSALDDLMASIRTPEEAALQRSTDRAKHYVPDADTRVQVAKSMLEAFRSKDMVSLSHAFVECAQMTVRNTGPFGSWCYGNGWYSISDGGPGKWIYREKCDNGYSPEGVLVLHDEWYEGELVCAVYSIAIGNIRLRYNSKDVTMEGKFWRTRKSKQRSHRRKPYETVANKGGGPDRIAAAAAIITSELACAFIQRVCGMIEDGHVEVNKLKDGLHLAYHWTSERNFPAILSGGLKVPGQESGVEHTTDEGYYGRGIYMSPLLDQYKMYGAGAEQCLLCLCLPGRQFPAKYPQHFGIDLVTGFDSHVSDDDTDGPKGSQWIMFSSDQILPVFLSDQRTRYGCDLIASNLIEQIVRDGKVLLLMKHKLKLKLLLKDVLRAFGKDPFKIARRWPRLLMHYLRLEQGRRVAKVRTRIMKGRRRITRQMRTAEEWEAWRLWRECERHTEQADQQRQRRSKGQQKAQKARRLQDQSATHRPTRKRNRKWEKIAKAEGRDVKMIEPLYTSSSESHQAQ